MRQAAETMHPSRTLEIINRELRRELGPARVLLAEVDPALRARVAGLLRDEGYAVVEFGSGAPLLAELEKRLSGQGGGPPALVIAGASLPEVGGLGVLGWLRRLDRDTPFILLNGPGGPTAEAERLGACVLPLPLDVDDLELAALALAEP